MRLGYLILPEKRRGAPLPAAVHDVAEVLVWQELLFAAVGFRGNFAKKMKICV